MISSVSFSNFPLGLAGNSGIFPQADGVSGEEGKEPSAFVLDENRVSNTNGFTAFFPGSAELREQPSSSSISISSSEFSLVFSLA
uniref:Uncharacterized protein n=1 Tax=Anguilla anguilla TaxID=7936 RepID=A0A0E9XKC1_ANGAN